MDKPKNIPIIIEDDDGDGVPVSEGFKTQNITIASGSHKQFFTPWMASSLKNDQRRTSRVVCKPATKRTSSGDIVEQKSNGHGVFHSQWRFSDAVMDPYLINQQRRLPSNSPHSVSSVSSDGTLRHPPNIQPVKPIYVRSESEASDENYADEDFLIPADYKGDVSITERDRQSNKYLNQILNNGEVEEVGQTSRPSNPIDLRNPPITYPKVVVKEALINRAVKLRAGKVVELRFGGFMLITVVIEDKQSGRVCIRGYSLARMKYLNGVFERKQNEVCCMIDIDLDDPRPVHEQSVVEAEASEVVRIRRLHVTNNAYPENTYRNNGGYPGKEVDDYGELAMRFCYRTVFASATMRLKNVNIERAIEHLLESHVASFGKPPLGSDSHRRELWRGATLLGGSAMPPAPNTKSETKMEQVTIDLTQSSQKRQRASLYDAGCKRICLDSDDDDAQLRSSPRVERTRIDLSEISLDDEESLPSPSETGLLTTPRGNRSIPASINPFHSDISTPPEIGKVDLNSVKRMTTVPLQKGQAYTFGDAFCGAGGTTRGAHISGLQIKYGFDKDEHVAISWAANFPKATMYKNDAHDVVQWPNSSARLQVDVLHMSPPCQFFSPAHTVAGIHDVANFAVIFACGNILGVAKPRAGTLEQTFGIMHAVFRQVFNTIICMMTSLGYSVRWTIAPLQDWGLPQRRYRLVIFFAGPGEPLPEFPKFTHAADPTPGSGLRRYRSVNDAIGNIPRGHPHHNPNDVARRNLKPWDGDSIAPRAMTTSGGQNYHPSGKRDFTNAEFAALQGFPLNHQFLGSYVRKQIGNAVPPIIAKLWFEKIIETLEKADGIEPKSSKGDTEVVVLDEDEEVSISPSNDPRKPIGREKADFIVLDD